MRLVMLAGLSLLLIASSLGAQASHPHRAARPGGVGRYVAPRDWPLRVRSFDLLHQRVEVAFDVPRRLVLGRVATRLVAAGARTKEVRLDAGNLTIDSALAPNGSPLRFAFDSSQVTVQLPQAAGRGDTVDFTLVYHTVPERGIYFVPRRGVIWSQGEATETRNWVPTYDAPDDKTTWEFLVTADSNQKVLSNGRLVGVTPAGAGRSVWHWTQDAPASTYLYSVVVGPFTVLRDQWRGVPVEYWTDADTVAAAWRTFGETPSMIELYSRLTGVNYPWAKYSQSIVPDFTYGGMENVSATTQTDLVLHGQEGEPEDAGRGLNAHELAHQWFGDYTTAAAWAHIWLNEGLTTYMESVQNEKSRGWDAGQLSWYQQQQQAMQADLNQERPLVWGQYEGDDPIRLFFSGHVYPKGAQVAHQLRHLLGDSLFWAGMHRFLVDNAHQPVTTPDFAVAFEKVSGRDLDWFFDQWAYGIGYPKVQVTRVWDAARRRLDVTVAQTQKVDSLHPLFRFPVTIRIVTRNAVVRREITISKARQTFPLALPGAPLAFRFDEGGWLLGTVSTDQSVGELADMARHDLEFAARNWALVQLAGSADSVATAARRFIVRNEHNAYLRALALGQLAVDHSPESIAAVRAALRDPASQVRAGAIGALAALDSAGIGATAQSMYASDPNAAVRRAALAAYANACGLAALPALLEASTPDHPAGMRATAAAALGKLKDPRATDALERMTAPAETRQIRGAALGDLVEQGDSARTAAIATRAIGDYDPLFAVQAVAALGRVGGSSGRTTLAAAAARESRVTVLAAIRRALRPK